MGIMAFRIISIGFLFSAVGVVFSGVFEALGKGERVSCRVYTETVFYHSGSFFIPGFTDGSQWNLGFFSGSRGGSGSGSSPFIPEIQ